jgi:hypothetical protein
VGATPRGELGGAARAGGVTAVTVGGVTTASTAIETPVTVASMAVALLELPVARVIADCTALAAAVGVWMLTPTRTLPDVTVNSTADGSTPALAAIALFISARTLGVKEETSPASSRLKITTLIAAGEGGGGGVWTSGGGMSGGGVVRKVLLDSMSSARRARYANGCTHVPNPTGPLVAATSSARSVVIRVLMTCESPTLRICKEVLA